VEALSDATGYTLTATRRGDFIALMQDWGVVDRVYTGGYGILGTTGDVPVKKIVVVFTTEEQQINQYVTSAGEVYLSSVTHATPGELRVMAHVGPLILDDPARANDLGTYVDTIVLTTLYSLSHDEERVRGEIHGPGSKLDSVLQETHRQGIRFFSLSRDE
jgi:hypothetical protein